MELYIIVWSVGGICLIGIIFLNFPLISRLKTHSLTEFQKAGEPSPYWSDSRSVKFMIYILTRKYESLADDKLISMFKIARMLWIIMLTCFVVFFVEVASMD